MQLIEGLDFTFRALLGTLVSVPLLLAFPSQMPLIVRLYPRMFLLFRLL